MMSKKSLKQRRRAHYLARRVIAFLRDNEEDYRIRIQRLTGNKKLCIEKYGMGTADLYGLIDYESCHIFVDFRNETMSTLIHEILHAIYMDALEREVISMEKLIMRHITEKQATKIWIYTAECMRVAQTD